MDSSRTSSWGWRAACYAQAKRQARCPLSAASTSGLPQVSKTSCCPLLGPEYPLDSAAAAIVGTATNTLLMCTCALMLGLAQPGELFFVAFIHGAFEMAAALLVVVPVTIALGGSRR